MAHRLKKFQALILIFSLLALILGMMACSSSATTTVTPVTTTTPGASPGGPGGGAVVNSDSIVTAKIQALRKQTAGYPWEVDVLIQTADDVGALPNPVVDKIGQTVTVKTDQDMSSFKVNDSISARIKYVGDVPRPGITLYMYNVALK